MGYFLGSYTFHNLLDFHFDNGDFTSVGIIHVASDAVNGQGAVFHSSHIIILTCLLVILYLKFSWVAFFTSRKMTLFVCSMTALASEAKKYSTCLSSSSGWNSAVEGVRGIREAAVSVSPVAWPGCDLKSVCRKRQKIRLTHEMSKLHSDCVKYLQYWV